jgi:YrbI family 3-deoxy-D-manno-octulosonate 8-phosphate phosphatase
VQLKKRGGKCVTWRTFATEEIALEIKTFDAHDGQGLTLAHTAGLRTGCITGRQSSALLRRAREMNMEFIYMKPAKNAAYEEILRNAGVPDSSVAYVGDDLPDLPVMRRAGLAVAVGQRSDLVSQLRRRMIGAYGDAGRPHAQTRQPQLGASPAARSRSRH